MARNILHVSCGESGFWALAYNSRNPQQLRLLSMQTIRFPVTLFQQLLVAKMDNLNLYMPLLGLRSFNLLEISFRNNLPCFMWRFRLLGTCLLLKESSIGHIISTTIGDKNGELKLVYASSRITLF